MNFTENFLLYFETYKFFAHLMVYGLIATNIDIKSCEMKCENRGGILPQDFRMLAIDDIYISGAVKLWKLKILVEVSMNGLVERCTVVMGAACIVYVTLYAKKPLN